MSKFYFLSQGIVTLFVGLLVSNVTFAVDQMEVDKFNELVQNGYCTTTKQVVTTEYDHGCFGNLALKKQEGVNSKIKILKLSERSNQSWVSNEDAKQLSTITLVGPAIIGGIESLSKQNEISESCERLEVQLKQMIQDTSCD